MTCFLLVFCLGFPAIRIWAGCKPLSAASQPESKSILVVGAEFLTALGQQIVQVFHILWVGFIEKEPVNRLSQCENSHHDQEYGLDSDQIAQITS